MASRKTMIDTTHEQKANFEKYITYKLQETFNNEIYEKGETQAKLDILNNKDYIIDSIIYTIKQNVPLNFKYYWRDSSITETILTINDLFLKIYNDTFKAYKVKQNAEKEYYKQVLYDTITKDIENALEYQDIENVLLNVKKIDYKKTLFETLQEDYEDININVINDIYLQTLNKVVNNYKCDLYIYKEQKKITLEKQRLYRKKLQEEEKTFEKQRLQQEKARKNKIPFAWKWYAGAKAINKLMK